MKKNRGITLIALVISIIVLLILAGISISMLSGDNGLLKRAGQARDDTIIGEEKEQVELAYISAAVKKLGDNVTYEDLQDELDISVGENKTKVTTNANDTLNVLYKDTEHNYNVDNGKVLKVINDNNIDTDLKKLQDYFVGKKLNDVWDDDNSSYINNEILEDASSISWKDYGNAENYSYEVIEYKSSKYTITEKYDEDANTTTFIEVSNFKVKDVTNIVFGGLPDVSYENGVLKHTEMINNTMRDYSNLFEIEELEIVSNDESIISFENTTNSEFENDWITHIHNSGNTTIILKGKESERILEINVNVEIY